MYHLQASYKKISFTILTPLFLCCLFGSGIAKANSGWQHEATIYGWLAGIDGTAQTPVTPENGADLEVPVEDILDNLNMIFMGGWTSKKGKWSIIGDVIYVDVGGSTDKLDIELDITSWVVNGGIGYDLVQTDSVSLAVVGGVRYMNVEPAIDIRSVSRSQSEDILDGLIGLRGAVNLNQNWFLPYYADIGTGGSDYSYQLFAGVGYQFGWGDVRLGYRYLSFELGDDKVMKDIAIYGPVLGVGFRF